MKNFMIKKLDMEGNIWNGSEGIILDFSKIIKIRTRTEGGINWDWTIHFKDGTSIELYSIDNERPLYGTDQGDHPIDDEGREFLDNIPQPPFDEEDEFGMELEWETIIKDGKFLPFQLITHHEIHEMG